MASKLLSSPIGKKLGMALTGLVFYGFLVGHLGGNLLLLNKDGGQAFNTYSEFLVTHPLLIPVELFLLTVFVLHIYLAIHVSIENRRARPVGYQMTQSTGGRTWSSRSMIFSGLLVLVFVVLHLRSFKYGDRGEGTLYDLVTSTFQQTGYMVWYVVVMTVLGLHLRHAFQSAFQTLSIHNRKIRLVGLLLSLILAAGFGFLPICMGLLSK